MRGKKTVLSVVQQRQTIADGLLRLMKELGISALSLNRSGHWQSIARMGTEQADIDQAKENTED